MKAIKITLRILSFTATFIIPIVLLGVISPLVHGQLGSGLTGLGYIAVALAIVVTAFKLLGKILKMEKGWKRALIISAFSLSLWLVIWLGIDYVQVLILSISQYWLKVGLFLALGQALSVLEQCLHEPPKNEAKQGEGVSLE